MINLNFKNILFFGLTYVSLFLLMACKDDDSQPTHTVTNISPESGPKTSIVTITGSGFSTVPNENVVTLNDFPCPVSSATATELKITIPAKAGSGNLTVTIKGRSVETTHFTYIYTQTTVTTLAGSSQGDVDNFSLPTGVAVDNDGNEYVADYGNHKIKR